MKTTVQTLNNIFRISLIAGTLFIFSNLQASDTKALNSKTNFASLTSSVISIGNDPVASETTAVKNPMLDDSTYWVNYLKNTIRTDEEDTSSLQNPMNEMNSNPRFWVDYLKEITISPALQSDLKEGYSL
ncbi:MAG: hypothetical protein WCO63_05550 [Bacteroidota bacterium]